MNKLPGMNRKSSKQIKIQIQIGSAQFTGHLVESRGAPEILQNATKKSQVGLFTFK